jgi:hypothetical protein
MTESMSATAGTNLETTNDEKPGLETVNVGVLKEEKRDWVLVGDNAVFQILQHITGCVGEYSPNVPSLRGCEEVSMVVWDKGGVTIAAVLAGDRTSGEEDAVIGHKGL